jgi:hypothetical protein
LFARIGEGELNMIRKQAGAVFVVVMLFLLTGSISTSGSAAEDVGAFEPQLASATTPSTIYYQGRLTNPDGEPLNGSFNFKFQVWDAESGGLYYGTDTIVNGVMVENGLFAVNVDVPHNAFDGQRLWLQVYVNDIPLSPRQELLAAPYALSLKPGASITSPDIDTLHVGNSSSGWAVEAWSTGNIALLGTSGSVSFNPPSGLHGVHGVGEDVGVYGKSYSGDGVYAGSESGYGLYAESITHAGVYGTSDTGNGVRGYSPDLAGVYGESDNYHGIYGTTGQSGPGNWSGVYGYSTDAIGVTGMSDNYNGMRALSGSSIHAALTAGNLNAGPAIYAETTEGTVAAIFKGNLQVRSVIDDSTVVELGEGLDYAEGFNVSGKQEVLPGMVLVIDPGNPGKLALSQTAYDRKVAGVAAGGNDLGSAVQIGAGSFDLQVALAGRVYCFVDASYGAVQPGDLLTSSPTTGYAMAVSDYKRAQGAILGKAMEALGFGQKDQILILVTLQ